jgi:uncharacterized protein (TIGR02271 family)
MDQTQVTNWIGRTLVDSDGEKIGTVQDIYLDEDTDEPEWLAVSTGWFGNRISFVPLAGATVRENEVACRWTKDQVKDSPNAEPDGRLTQDEEAGLYRHYGLDYSEDRSSSGLPDRSGAPAAGGDSDDDAMTRSEEELRVATTSREAGRVRMRKWVETEHVTKTVPVTREEVRVQREPISADNADAAMSGAEISEAEHEVTLHEDQVVANTEVVPKERVRLGTERVQDEETVSADLRKERIDVEGDTNPRR